MKLTATERLFLETILDEALPEIPDTAEYQAAEDHLVSEGVLKRDEEGEMIIGMDYPKACALLGRLPDPYLVGYWSRTYE